MGMQHQISHQCQLFISGSNANLETMNLNGTWCFLTNFSNTAHFFIISHNELIAEATNVRGEVENNLQKIPNTRETNFSG